MPDEDQKHDPLEPTSPGEPPEEDGDDTTSEDRFAPDAIAARIEQIGEETDLDRVARQEEQKLLERKKLQKKSKRGSLEAAASKRLAKIGEGSVRRPSAASDAYIPEADPLMARARRARGWIEQHRTTFGVLVGVALIGVGSALGFTYVQGKRNADASALLAMAFADEHGHIADKEDEEEDDSARSQQVLYPTFKSVTERRAAAIAKYREVSSKYAGTGAATLARLAEGALLLDEGDSKAAISAYDDVKGSPLAQADAEVRGRALEGRGFACELLAESDSANQEKHLDDALAEFKALEAIDVDGFKELGMYHEARVLQAKGDKGKAIEILKDTYKRTTDPGSGGRFTYLEFVIEDRLRDLDPNALPPKAPKHPAGGLGGPGSPDMSSPQMQELLRRLQQQQGQKGMPPAPNGPR